MASRLLGSLLLLPPLLAGAAPGAPWQPTEFPIGYWFGPLPQHNNLATWQQVKDCGFTVAGMSGFDLAGNLQMLDHCQQVGLKAIVIDRRVTGWETLLNDGWQEAVAAVVKDYGGHPALYGYYLQDEPNAMAFPPLGELAAEFERRDPDHLAYVNLFPTYASAEQLGTPTYAEHLDRYLTTVRPRVLSYDHYALMKGGQDRPDWYENLALVREAGLRHQTPPWVIVLSIPHFGYRDPSAAEMRWQVYTSLAYGMKGLLWFTYATVPDWEQEGGAIVDSQGRPARLYPIVQQLNRELQVVGKTLLGLTSTAVYHTGPTIPAGATRLPQDEILAPVDDPPLVIGRFVDAQGRPYAMLTNPDHQAGVDLVLRLKPHVKDVLALNAQDGSEAALAIEGGQMKLHLDAGDGRLLRLVTAFDYPTLPPPLDRIAFEFDTPGDLEGWGGWYNLSEAAVQGGSLRLTVTGDDPHGVRRFLRVPADTYRVVKVRMRLTGGAPAGQVFWTTAASPNWADDKYLNFAIQPDGEWHEYTVPVGEHALWRGQVIRGLRLDPTTGGAPAGTTVAIDWIRGE